MKVQVLNASVVVLADAHNPSILHPTFLTTQQIVPETWTLAEKPLCTPPISIIKFDNGIVFTVESSKLQILQNDPPEKLHEADVESLADKYIKTLPHVRYTAVGVNFTALVETADPSHFLIDRFLKNGAWNDDGCAPSTLTVGLAYPADPGELRISCEAGKMKPAGSSPARDGILVKANFSLPTSGPDHTESARGAISLFATRCTQFAEYIQRIIKA